MKCVSRLESVYILSIGLELKEYGRGIHQDGRPRNVPKRVQIQHTHKKNYRGQHFIWCTSQECNLSRYWKLFFFFCHTFFLRDGLHCQISLLGSKKNAFLALFHYVLGLFLTLFYTFMPESLAIGNFFFASFGGPSTYVQCQISLLGSKKKCMHIDSILCK